MISLRDVGKDISAALDEAASRQRPALRAEQVGVVTRIGPGVAEVEGLSGLASDELLAFPDELLGAAVDIAEDHVGVILFGASDALKIGAEARPTRRVIDAPVGPCLLGRVVDALGRPLDDRGPLGEVDRWLVERPAPSILDRAPVSRPLHTGIKAVDAAVPVGKGQRELIVGDRQTGKTAVAVSAMLKHKGRARRGDSPGRGPAICVYCAIGQRAASVARVIDTLRREDALSRTIVIVAGGNDAPGLQYIAPYAATSMAEWFMRRGEDVLIVFDDLTRHARAYRELALLLGRPPGREAYPGDIFYIHARLLERATHLRAELGGGSLTALPIIETQAQNIASYIPTNLISITDGQIYLSPELFEKGLLPAIDIGKSVSRVGDKAQLPAFRAVSAELRLSYAQFEELEVFSRFGTRLDEETRRKLARGRRVREALKQRESERPSPPEQIAWLLAVNSGLLDDVALSDIREAEAAVRKAVRQADPKISTRIEAGAPFTAEDRANLLAMARKALSAPR